MDVTFSAEEQFRRGKELFAAGQEEAAFEYFRTAQSLHRENACYRSYYGVALARVERRFNKGLEFCRAAVKEEFFNPELYHNLARVYLAFGFKSEALRYLRRGLMIDPACQAIQTELGGLGVRQSPVLTFLPRRHRINRLLGRLRQRFTRSHSNWVPAEDLS